MKRLSTDAKRSALMKRVRRSGTSAEIIVAEALRSAGLHYRRNVRSLAGTPDFANKSAGWAIFVNGCFWHHHRCARGTTPKRNCAFWETKFRDNRRRDANKIRCLRSQALQVHVIWECETLVPELLGARVARIGLKRKR